MSIELRPITEFDPTKLAPELAELVRTNADELQRRYYGRIVLAYEHGAEEAVTLAKQRAVSSHTGILPAAQTFVAMAEAGTEDAEHVIGIGTIIHGLVLGANKLRMPSRIARHVGLLRVEYPAASRATSANISGWVDSGSADQLEDLYVGLRQKLEPGHIAWTVEPLGSDLAVHGAIVGAGISRLQPGAHRFDVGEDAGLPPQSYLYATDPDILPTTRLT